jgi:hypothetical protein
VDCWFFVNSSLNAFIMVLTSLLLMHSSSLSPTGGGGGCTYFGGIVNRKQHNWLSVSKNKSYDRRWEHTISQAAYPTLMSVLFTLQVATSGHVIIRRVWGECKVKSILLGRRCCLEGKIWCLDKWNLIIDNQVEQVFTSRDSLLGEPMFKVEYDDTKRRCKRKAKQR